jgi:hypothetical protein
LADASTRPNEELVRAVSARIAQATAAGIAATALTLTVSAPTAAAPPPGFPDLDTFASISVDAYIVTGPKGPKRFVAFSTPYNIECSFIATNDPVPAGATQGINCDGEIPGVASGPTPTESCATGKVGDWGASGFRIERELINCPIGTFSSGVLLTAGHKVTYQNVTCAVGDNGLIACLDTSLGHHGFALRPAGNVTF